MYIFHFIVQFTNIRIPPQIPTLRHEDRWPATALILIRAEGCLSANKVWTFCILKWSDCRICDFVLDHFATMTFNRQLGVLHLLSIVKCNHPLEFEIWNTKFWFMWEKQPACIFVLNIFLFQIIWYLVLLKLESIKLILWTSLRYK